MEQRLRPYLAGGAGPVLGLLLVLAGIALLLLQYVSFDLGHYGWPIFVIGPGVLLLLIGMLLEETSGLVIPGVITTAVGLVLAVQNTFDLWSTWAYAWALVLPGAAGVGIALRGLRRGDVGQVRKGTRGALTGLVLFAVLGAFFEGVLDLSGFQLGSVGRLSLAVVLIVIGVLILALWMMGPREKWPPESTQQSLE
jgi:hypothetical protein